MNNNIKSCKWLLTINNPDQDTIMHDSIKEVLSSLDLQYWCMCDEISENDIYHIHLLIITKSAVTFEYIKKRFPVAHIDYCKCSAGAVRDYIRKEGKYERMSTEEINIPDTFEEYGIFLG